VEGLDSALPERKAKRGREGREREGGEERASKRQTPDRRLEGKRGGRGRGEKRGGGAGAGAGGGEGNAEREKERKGRIADDPVEKAKMEARAKKFGKPLAT
jgi:SAP domain-containing ribonucleoprotein